MEIVALAIDSYVDEGLILLGIQPIQVENGKSTHEICFQRVGLKFFVFFFFSFFFLINLANICVEDSGNRERAAFRLSHFIIIIIIIYIQFFTLSF
jgi:hypothetical protein